MIALMCAPLGALLVMSAQPPDSMSFGALRREAGRRGSSADLGKFDAMRKIGPHSTTSPREVVEHVLTELREGDMQQAFNFTALPPWRQGTHRSVTDWTQRMDWEKCQVIHGTCTGGLVDRQSFEQLMRRRYAALLDTEQYRFIGDGSAWQQKDGAEKMTAVKVYVVEVRTRSGDHLLLKFKLVYDWLLYCHMVASVLITAVSTDKFFPGADDADLDLDI